MGSVLRRERGVWRRLRAFHATEYRPGVLAALVTLRGGEVILRHRVLKGRDDESRPADVLSRRPFFNPSLKTCLHLAVLAIPQAVVLFFVMLLAVAVFGKSSSIKRRTRSSDVFSGSAATSGASGSNIDSLATMCSPLIR